MLTDEKIEKYKQDKRLDFQFNILFKRSAKKKLDKIAKEKGITTSELVRLLIYEFIKKYELPNQGD